MYSLDFSAFILYFQGTKRERARKILHYCARMFTIRHTIFRPGCARSVHKMMMERVQNGRHK